MRCHGQCGERGKAGRGSGRCAGSASALGQSEHSSMRALVCFSHSGFRLGLRFQPIRMSTESSGGSLVNQEVIGTAPCLANHRAAGAPAPLANQAAVSSLFGQSGCRLRLSVLARKICMLSPAFDWLRLLAPPRSLVAPPLPPRPVPDPRSEAGAVQGLYSQHLDFFLNKSTFLKQQRRGGLSGSGQCCRPCTAAGAGPHHAALLVVELRTWEVLSKLEAFESWRCGNKKWGKERDERRERAAASVQCGQREASQAAKRRWNTN